MFGTHFYNQGLRKLTIAFGQIFNNIIIQHKIHRDDSLISTKIPSRNSFFN